MSSRKAPTPGSKPKIKSKTSSKVPIPPKSKIINSPLFKNGRIGVSSSPIKRGSASKVSVGRNNLGDYLEVEGHEYISTITIAAASAPGAILLQRPNTVAIANTRLAQFAGIYERWEPVLYQYHFTSSLPATTPGAYVMVNDPDPSNPWTSGVALNIPNAFTMSGSSRGQFWEGSTSSLPSERDYTSLWCRPATVEVGDAEDRLSAAGQFLFICVVPTGTTQVVGFIELEYRIRFYLPRLVNNASSSVTIKVPFPELFNSPTRPAASSVGAIAGTLAYLLREGTKIDEDKILRALRDAINLPNTPPLQPGDAVQSPISATTVGLPSGSYQINAVVVDGRDTDSNIVPFQLFTEFQAVLNASDATTNGSFGTVTTGLNHTQHDWDGTISTEYQYFSPDGILYTAAYYQDYEMYVLDGDVSNGIVDWVFNSAGILTAAYPNLILFLTIGVTGNEHYYNPSASVHAMRRARLSDIDKLKKVDSKTESKAPPPLPVSDDDEGEIVPSSHHVITRPLRTPPTPDIAVTTAMSGRRNVPSIKH